MGGKAPEPSPREKSWRSAGERAFRFTATRQDAADRLQDPLKTRPKRKLRCSELLHRSPVRSLRRACKATAFSSVCYFGMITESMTWITPLEAAMSVAVTLAPSTLTLPPLTMIFTD